MSGQVISLVEALKPRACNVAAELSKRLIDPGLWRDYVPAEGLIGELRLSRLLTFHRPGVPMAILVFRNPQMVGMRHVDWGDPVVLEANITERHASHVVLDKAVRYKEMLEHELSEVQTLWQQVTAGLEATLKIGGEVGTEGGIHGVTAKVYAELTARIYGEYQRNWGNSKTESTKASREIEVEGPIRIDYEAVRSRNREQRTIRADCDYEHTVELIDETGAGERPPKIQLVCPSWGAFRQVIQGFAPRHDEIEYEDGRRLVETAFYDEFINNPIRDEALEQLSAPAKGAIELLVEYDNVIAQDIKVL